MTAPPTTAPGLGASAARGAFATLAGQLGRIAIQLTGVVLLARLLTPNDYGVLAMVLAVIGVGEIFRDFGLATAAISAKTLSREEKSNLFYMNSGIGLGLSILALAASWPIALLYGDERLQPVAAALSVTFLVMGVLTQFRADLNRKLRLARLAGVEIASQSLALGIAIASALGGFGYWSLVIQQVSQPIIQLIILLFVTGWFPGLPHPSVSMRRFWRFGGNVTGAQLLGYLSRNVDSVVIGATVGATALGLYNRAFQLMLLPLNQINAPSSRIALPVLSRLQDDPVQFTRYLRVGQTAMLTLLGLLLALCGAQAGPIILISLGEQWAGSVPIFQVLAIAGFFQVATYASYWVFIALDKSGPNLRFALVSRPLMVVIIAIGGFWGVMGVAIAYTLALALSWPAAIWYLGRVSDAPARMMFLNGLRALLVYGSAAIVSVLATLWLPADELLLRLLVGTAALLVTVALAALVSRPYRADLRAIAAIPALLRRRRGAADQRIDDTDDAGDDRPATDRTDVVDGDDAPPTSGAVPS